MKIAKRILSAFLAVLMLLSLTLMAGATTDDEKKYLSYSQFRASTEGMGIVDSKTPLTSNDVQERWKMKFGTGWSDTPGTPIVIGDYLYCLVPGQSLLHRVDAKTGEKVKSVPCKGSSQFFSMIGYGDGIIFVPRSTTTADGKSVSIIMAYDEETMDMLWQSEPIGDVDARLQPLSAITYYNGYVYVSVSDSNGSKGAFACFKVTDDDTTKTDEVKKATWVYTPDSDMKSGYYWCGGVIVGNSIIFGGEATELVIHSLTEDKVFDKITLETNVKEGIRSNLHYDSELNAVFISTKEGNIYSIKLTGDGKFDRASLKKANIGYDITSSPVVFKGRVYVGGGGISSNAGFTVLNAETMEVVYQINDIKSQSSPIITTAYATEENNWKVYAYVVKYNGYENRAYAPNSSCLYAISDSVGQTAPSYEELITPSVLQYCTQTPAIDKDGNFYYYNDSGNLFSFGHKDSKQGEYTAADVDNAILLAKSNSKVLSTDLFTLKRTETRYNALSDSEKSKVKYIDDLKALIATAENLKNEIYLIEKLNKELSEYDFSNITLANDKEITDFMSVYSSLSADGKNQIIKKDELIRANEKLNSLKNDKVAALINAKIDALPSDSELCFDDKKAVDDILLEISNQSDEVKAKINMDKLNSAKTRVTDIENSIKNLNDRIWNEINPMNITLNDEAAVNSIIADYEKISAKDKKHIKGFDEVLEAQKTINALKNETITDETVKENPEIPKTGEQNYFFLFPAFILMSFAVLYISKPILRKKVK